jgi:voltage-gated potassium channel Kch
MAEFTEIKNNLYVSIALVIIIYILGTVFYHYIEGWSYLESVYFVTMTITTIGYGDFVPKTEIGMVFSIFLALIGISVAFFLIYSIAAYREKTFDREVLGKLMMFKNLTSLRGKKDMPKISSGPRFLRALKGKLGEI